MESASHSGVEVITYSPDEQQAISEALEAFGVQSHSESSEGATEATQESEGQMDEPPATEEAPEPRTIKVKHNKQEIEVDVSDDKLPEYVQKSFALDKERERKAELEKILDRAAKLSGFENHADYVANLDRLEQEAKKREDDQFTDLKKQLRQEAEEAGLDADKMEAYLENHPLMKRAQLAVLERQKLELEHKVEQSKQLEKQKWNEMYEAYPELVESSHLFDEGGTPDWYTPEMQERIARGYDPKDAYELAHRATIQERSRKLAEQRAIKEARLGARSQVSGQESADAEPDVPPEVMSAFAMFGLDPKLAKKYVKK